MAGRTRQFKHPIPIVGADRAGQASVADGVITPEQLMTAMKPNKDVLRIRTSGGLQLTVRAMISAADAAQFIDAVLQPCWNGSGYYYEMIDFAFRCAVITCYSNVRLPEKVEEKYDVVYGTDLYDTILQYANRGQIDALYDAVNIYIGR